MPCDGYTALFQRLLDHPRITVELGVEYEEARSAFRHGRTIFTGPIDEFFTYARGPLPYRSLRFKRRVETKGAGLPVGTVNFPNEFDFTRITDQRHLSGALNAAPLLISEYPEPYVPGSNEPYYPIPCNVSSGLYELYRQDAAEFAGHVFFAGRLGDYAYYNMDQACARALALFEKQIVPLVQGTAPPRVTLSA
jgi:UDP-galactopyranose mutase